MFAAANCGANEAAVAFGCICPVRPQGPTSKDHVGDVEKSMHGDGACSNAIRVVLIVEAAAASVETLGVN